MSWFSAKRLVWLETTFLVRNVWSTAPRKALTMDSKAERAVEAFTSEHGS